MGGGSWVVQKGFLLRKREETESPRPLQSASAARWRSTKSVCSNGLEELYVVLTMNRKLEFFDSSDPATQNKVDSAYLQGFAGWDGDGQLKVNSYGLELKVERNAKSRMYLAALNRLDLEKWCRGFMAVLDPHSAPGEEVRRERRRVKKEEKRLQEEREEKIRKWKEKKAKMIKEEQDRLLAREEEINNMTPLERVDGLGSLDDDTARMLEKRKLRLQRRHAPTTGRVNKAAYRRRLEEAAGGKTDNVQPLQKKIVEQKTKIRVELPPPGQFFEVGGLGHNHAPIRLGSSGSDLSESSSISSRLSSVSSATGSRYDGSSSFTPPPPPPPPPPPSHWSASSSQEVRSSKVSKGIPPPPPLFELHNLNDRKSRLSRSSSSLRSASFDSFAVDGDEVPEVSRSSFSQTRSHVSSVDKSKQDVQSNLASILAGERPKVSSRASYRRDSFTSTTTSKAGRDQKPMTNSSTPSRIHEPSMANAFAASLAAIRRKRDDTVVEKSGVDSVANSIANSQINGKARDRKRDSQLSAEGKEILKKAMSCSSMHDATVKNKTEPNAGRRGLFDDSSSDDGSETGLFGVSGHQRSKATNGTSSARKSVRSSESSWGTRSAQAKKAISAASLSSNDDISSDSDSDNEVSLFVQSRKSPSPSMTPPSVIANNVGAGGAGPSVVVLFTMSALRSEGKKMVGVFTYTLQFGNLAHSFSFTYSEFEAIHTRLTAIFPGITLPKFPSKHRLRNNTKPENMDKRAQELRLYLQQLVALPEVLSNERFQLEYHIDGDFAKALTNNQKPAQSAQKLVPRQDLTSPVSISRFSEAPRVQSTDPRPRPSKELFGLNDSDPESNSDTSIDTPKPLVVHQQRESTASSTVRRRSKKSELSSSGISSVPESKRSRSQSRQSSRASSRASFVPPPPSSSPEPRKPTVPGLPVGRPNPFAGDRGDLLAAIRQGTRLKKTTDSAVSSSSEGVSPTKIPPPPPSLTQSGSINEAITNAMAMRRIHVEYEETHSSAGSDSDDDWD